MITKDDYQEIGRTKEGERVLRNTKNGCICTEKDHLYRIQSTHKEMEEAGIALIEESCGSMKVWIPIGERPDGKKTFGNTKDGRLAVRTGKNRMEIIEPSTVKAMTAILDSYQIDIDEAKSMSDLFLARKKGKVK